MMMIASSCQKAGRAVAQETGMPVGTESDLTAGTDEKAVNLLLLEDALISARIPEKMAERIRTAAAADGAFFSRFEAVQKGDPFLCMLVDKNHSLPEGYAPDDLIRLTSGRSYRVTRDNLMLRRAAAEALEQMAAAARAEGVTLTVGSTYRSYGYQVEVYARIVQEIGQAAADRESARPGFSQHQTGLVVDFFPIDDSFADTKAGAWVKDNAVAYGWSLSFPDGFEEVTGYRYESWHYRYVGRELASFINTYFDGIQQYALQFIHAWQTPTGF
jgi:D-alanyl-D-alanine carboxypeptidase